MMNSRLELIGIASFMYRQCGTGKPDCFSSVPMYAKWIEINTGIPPMKKWN